MSGRGPTMVGPVSERILYVRYMQDLKSGGDGLLNSYNKDTIVLRDRVECCIILQPNLRFIVNSSFPFPSL